MSQESGRMRYLTVNEVADEMRISRMTVYRLLHSGELPGVRVGRSFRVPEDALAAYLRSSANAALLGNEAERRSS